MNRSWKLAINVALALLAAAPVLAGRIAIAATPRLPSWIVAGRMAEYLVYSGDIEVVAVNKVTSVVRNVVYATTTTQTVGSPLRGSYNWDCSAAGICAGRVLTFQFWVDPNDPTGSTRGPDGEIYEYLGKTKLTDPWKRVWTQPSPHFEAAIAIGKSPAPATASANFAMSGASRCSGMVGISS